MLKARTFGLAIAGALLAASAAHAGQAQDMAAIQNFRLTDDFMAKYQAVEDDTVKDPCNLTPLGLMRSGSHQSLDQMAAAYDAQPGVHAMLARHGLAARDEILGMTTLMLSALEVAQKEHPDLVKRSGNVPPVSADNLAYYKAHAAALHQHAMELGKQQLAANHGKLPACMQKQ